MNEDNELRNDNENSSYGFDREGYKPYTEGENRRPAAPRGMMRSRRPRMGHSEQVVWNDNRRPMGDRPQGAGPRFHREHGEGGERGGFGSNRFGNSRNQGDYAPRYGRERGGRNDYNNGERPYRPQQRKGGFYRNQGEGEHQDWAPRNYGAPRERRDWAPRNQGNRERQDWAPRNYERRPRSNDYDPNAKYSAKKRMEYKEEHFDPTVPVRLNKFLANAGVCSRRDADKYIEAGVVTVNGTVVTELGSKVLRTDEVRFHDQPVTLEKKVYVLLNKPKDYVTTSEDPQNRKTVMDLVRNACSERIYPVGRLDRNTTGVLLLTNDGDLASKLTHPKFLKKKIYHVHTDKNVTAHDMQQIATGITLDDGEIHADAIEYASPTDKKQIGIEIHSGKNRIVRRIFESLGYHVIKLDRVYFAGLTKKNLRRGDWRYLTEKEVSMLRMGAFE